MGGSMGNTNTPQPVPRAAYWTLAALFGMNLLNFVDRYILASVLEKIQEGTPAGLGLSDEQAGVVGSAFFLAYALISPLVGWLGDRMTRKYMLAGSVGLWSLATFASGLVQSYEQLILARSVLAIGEATYTALAASLIADLFPPEKRGRVLTFFYLAVPLGAAIGYPLGGQLSSWWGWRTAFFVVGLPGLAVAVAALALREPERSGAEHVDEEHRRQYQAQPFSWRLYGSLIWNYSYLYNALAMAMFTFALGGLQLFAAKYFAQLPGMDLKKANNNLGPVLCVSGLIGMSLGGWLAERLKRRWRGAYFWVSGFSLLASVPFIFLALAGRQLFGEAGCRPFYIFPLLFVGLTLAFMNIGPSNTIITNVIPPKIRTAAVAANLFITRMLGDIPSPWLMGAVSVWTGSLFWGVGIAMPALVAAGIFFLLGAPHLDADQDAVLEQLRKGNE
jgi:predicted MFS family arabinose efflux permease